VSSSQKIKSKFRATSVWKKFRKQLKEERSIDEVTLKPLYKGFQCHHKNLNEDYYTDISNKDNFATLNKQTHDFIHWAFRYYEKDPQFADRFLKLLKEMKEING